MILGLNTQWQGIKAFVVIDILSISIVFEKAKKLLLQALHFSLPTSLHEDKQIDKQRAVGTNIIAEIPPIVSNEKYVQLVNVANAIKASYR